MQKINGIGFHLRRDHAIKVLVPPTRPLVNTHPLLLKRAAAVVLGQMHGGNEIQIRFERAQLPSGQRQR